MGFFSFFGSMMIAGAVAVAAERWGWTHNGLLPSLFIALGAVFVLFMVRATFGLSLGSPGLDAAIGSAAALVLIPTEVASKRRNKNSSERPWRNR